MKICTCCKNKKDLSCFLWKTSKGCTWIEGKCKDCQAEERKIKYHSNLELSREKSRNNGKRFYHRHRETLLEKNKEIRKQPDNHIILHQRKYYKDNEEKIKKQSKPIKRKSYEKQRDSLSDSYVINGLINKTKLKKEDILKYPELIEAKRLIIKIIRLTKN